MQEVYGFPEKILTEFGLSRIEIPLSYTSRDNVCPCPFCTTTSRQNNALPCCRAFFDFKKTRRYVPWYFLCALLSIRIGQTKLCWDHGTAYTSKELRGSVGVPGIHMYNACIETIAEIRTAGRYHTGLKLSYERLRVDAGGHIIEQKWLDIVLICN